MLKNSWQPKSELKPKKNQKIIPKMTKLYQKIGWIFAFLKLYSSTQDESLAMHPYNFCLPKSFSKSWWWLRMLVKIFTTPRNCRGDSPVFSDVSSSTIILPTFEQLSDKDKTWIFQNSNCFVKFNCSLRCFSALRHKSIWQNVILLPTWNSSESETHKSLELSPLRRHIWKPDTSFFGNPINFQFWKLRVSPMHYWLLNFFWVTYLPLG